MDEYSVIEERIERAQEINRRIIDAIPSTNSYMPASVSSIMEEIKIELPLMGIVALGYPDNIEEKIPKKERIDLKKLMI